MERLNLPENSYLLQGTLSATLAHQMMFSLSSSSPLDKPDIVSSFESYPIQPNPHTTTTTSILSWLLHMVTGPPGKLNFSSLQFGYFHFLRITSSLRPMQKRYPDVIESTSFKGPATTIKTHAPTPIATNSNDNTNNTNR